MIHVITNLSNDLGMSGDGEVIEERTLKIWRAMVPDDIQFIDQQAWHDFFFPDAQRIPVLCRDAAMGPATLSLHPKHAQAGVGPSQSAMPWRGRHICHYLPRMVALGGELKTLQLAALGEIKKMAKTNKVGGGRKLRKREAEARQILPVVQSSTPGPSNCASSSPRAAQAELGEGPGGWDGTGWDGMGREPSPAREAPGPACWHGGCPLAPVIGRAERACPSLRAQVAKAQQKQKGAWAFCIFIFHYWNPRVCTLKACMLA